MDDLKTDSCTKRTAVSGFIWRFMERFGAQGVTFVVSVVLARLLDPSVYGTIAIVTVFTSVLNAFAMNGPASALIQKKDADELDFSSVFFFNLFLCMMLYAAIYVCAPFIEAYYRMPDLCPVIRIMSLTVIVNGVKSVQDAYVSRNFLFKKYFYSTLGGTAAAALTGVWMAYQGYGVWALVMQDVVNHTADAAILWITVKWRPGKMFSAGRLKSLLSYGWKLLASSLADIFYGNLRQLIIGKIYAADALAYYNRGYTIPNVFVGIFSTAIDGVMFPVLSSEQNDLPAVRSMTRRSIQLSSFVMWPVMLGIAACARPIVQLLLTEKWLPAVPYVMIFCAGHALMPVQMANMNAIKALGCSDLFLKLEIMKKTAGIILLFLTVRHGPLVIAAGTLLLNPISLMINAGPNKRILDYSYRDQLLDIIPPALTASVMFLAVWSLHIFIQSPLCLLAVQIPAGAAVYISGSILSGSESFWYIWNLLRLKKP